MTEERMDDDVPVGDDASDGLAETSRSQTRRHLLVLLVAVVGLAIGGGLVISGRSPSDTRSTDRTTTSTNSGEALLPSLGVVPDLAAAKVLLNRLDPRTLRPDKNVTTTSGPSSTTPTSASATSAAGSPPTPGEAPLAGLRRCQRPITQQTTDRSLGDQLAAARLQVGVATDLVVSYALPASGSDPAGSRVLLVSARSCRVLAAVQH